MREDRLEQRLIDRWQTVAVDLGIRVTAPVELQDSAGTLFSCEALVHDFGSEKGALIISPKTERRIRRHLRSLGDDIWFSVNGPSTYNRQHSVAELLDIGWFGIQGEEPDWYVKLRG